MKTAIVSRALLPGVGTLLLTMGVLMPCISNAALPVRDPDLEFEYAAKLIELGFPEYAELAAEKVVKFFPDLKDRADVIRAESLIALRRFPQAEAIVSAMPEGSPKAQAIRLAMADGYYQIGEYGKCEALYRDFFAQHKEVPDDPDLLRFYQQAAHKFGQMLARQDNPRGAAEMYELLLAAITDREMVRQIKLEQSELLLRAARRQPGDDREEVLEKATVACNEVIWGGMDLWFGRAVACLAQVDILRGHRDDAAELLQSNLKILRKLDESLREADVPVAESPYAGGRSLLGTLYRNEAELLLGSLAKRQQEGLRYFDRALEEMAQVWALIKKMTSRDKVLAKRAEEDGRDVLVGTPAERQEPFDVMGQALRDFDELLASSGGSGGWEAEANEAANALKEKLQKLRAEVTEFPKDVGVTPSTEMILNRHFKGWEYIDEGKRLLADEGTRREKAIALYTDSLRQFYNVFAGYPGSDWAKDAGEQVSVLKERLHALTGKEVTIETSGGGRKKLGLVMISEGHDLFSREEYAKAVDAYIKGLNEYPESEQSIIALSNLMESYAKLKDPIGVKMVARYLAERFKDQPTAAQALLRTGRYYFEQNNREMYEYVYERFLAGFPDHQGAPTMLYMLGEQRWRVKDYPGAVPYYERVVKNYTKGPYFLKALNRIGWSYYLTENYERAAEVFTVLVKKAYPGLDKAQGQLCLADSYRQLGEYIKALQTYRELAKWLLEKDSPYTETPEARVRYQEMLEQAVFFQAYCLGRIEGTPERQQAYRKAGIDLFEKFVERFPTSKLAPTALSSLGAVLLGEGMSKEAAAVYEQLAEKYPESDAGQNARFAMVRSLVDIGQGEKAKDVVREMLSEDDKYPLEHFLRIGQLMLDDGFAETARLAYKLVVDGLKNKDDKDKAAQTMEQRAMFGLGTAAFDLKRYDDTIEAIDRLVTQYPTSGLFFEARFLLARAYKETDRPEEAIEILRDVFKRASDQNLLNRATLELARLQMAAGEKKDALASCQRIILLGDVDDPATRPLYSDALLISIRILSEDGRWEDVVEQCKIFTTHFPSSRDGDEVRRLRTTAMTKLALKTNGQ